MLKQRNVDTT